MTSKILNPSLYLSSYKHDGFLWAIRTIVLGVSISCKSGQCLLMWDKFQVPVVVQSLSRVWLFAIPWTAAWQVSLSFTISWSLLKLMSTESMMPSNYLILCCPLLLSSMFPSIRVFSNEWALHIRWPKYWSFRISPSNEYSGLISFRVDWFGLLAVQGTLKESSPAPQFESINSLALSLLYSPTRTSIHDLEKP